MVGLKKWKWVRNVVDTLGIGRGYLDSHFSERRYNLNLGSFLLPFCDKGVMLCFA